MSNEWRSQKVHDWLLDALDSYRPRDDATAPNAVLINIGWPVEAGAQKNATERCVEAAIDENVLTSKR